MKEKDQWLLIKHRDRFANGTDLAALDRSVLTGASVTDMKVVPAHRMPAERLIPSGPREKMPAKLEPMHAESGDAAFNKPGWMWEPKLDGYRVLAFVDAGGVRLISRRGLDLTASFPTVVAELTALGPCPMVLDGEIVAFDEQGRATFNAMQNAHSGAPVAYVCFDLLHYAGMDLRKSTYADRRRYLAQCVLPSRILQLVHVNPDGLALHEAALASGFEGVVGKRLDSRYEAGKRSGAWVKVKPTQSAEFVIGGWTQGKGSKGSFGALLVGYWEKEKLRFASHVGSGYDDRTIRALMAKLRPLERPTSPFVEKPELNATAHWVEPKVVAEVSFHQWTEDDRLRAPVFVKLRDDADAKEVRGERPEVRGQRSEVRGERSEVRGERPADDAVAQVLEQLASKKNEFTLAVGPHRIKLTNLDRVYWPADKALRQPPLTKRDLIRYLAQVSPFMIPHLRDRPLTMIRMPEGIHGQRFFQKHWTQARPDFVEAIDVFSSSKDENHEYLLANNLPTLLWLAQSGTLEFHVWHSRAALGPDTKNKSTDYDASLESLEDSILNFPDFVLFDLDPYIYSGQEKPGEEPELNTKAFEKGKEVAFWLRELLNSMGLEPIVKTSGKTGLHVFVPIKRTLDFDAAREVSMIVGQHLMSLHPKDITLEWSVPKRTGKIFMDYNMNVRGKTLNVAYSPRGAPGAPMSMPLAWDELAGAHPLDFRINNVAERLAQTGDRWADVLEAKQDLDKALKRRVKDT